MKDAVKQIWAFWIGWHINLINAPDFDKLKVSDKLDRWTSINWRCGEIQIVGTQMSRDQRNILFLKTGLRERPFLSGSWFVVKGKLGWWDGRLGDQVDCQVEISKWQRLEMVRRGLATCWAGRWVFANRCLEWEGEQSLGAVPKGGWVGS